MHFGDEKCIVNGPREPLSPDWLSPWLPDLLPELLPELLPDLLPDLLPELHRRNGCQTDRRPATALYRPKSSIFINEIVAI